MAGEKNFNIKNGLSIGGVEVIDSSGNIAAGGVGAAVQEAIADKIGGIIQGSGSTTVTYDDSADTITISSTGKTQEEIEDIVNGLVVGGVNVTSTYDDTAGTLTIDGQTDAAIRGLFSATNDLAYNSTTGAFTFTQRTDAQVRGLVSVTDAGGDGSAAYNSTTGVITYTGPSASETQAHISASGDLSYSSGVVSFTERTDEEVQDLVAGQLVTNGTHSGITAAYDDAGDGAIDLTVGTLNQSTTGSAATLTTPRAISGTNFDGSADITLTTAGITENTNLYYTDARVRSELTSLAGHIIPSADITYDLGSASKQWRDVFVGPGSLYVNGQQVVSDNSGTITISADVNQNVSVQTSGSGDVDLDPTGTGVIGLKGPVQVTAGSNISSSDGNAISFSNSIDVDAIESRTADTNLTLSANGTGIVTVNDALTVTGNLIVSGTTTTVNSETISLADNIIVLNSNFTSGTPSEDTGFSVLRGGSATKSFIWDESEDKWSVGSEVMVAGSFEGNLTGDVTGNVSGTSGSTTGNAATATALATARTIGLTGDVSGSGSFDGTGNLTITAVVADDSHNHTVANVDGLQTTLNTKYESGSNIAAGTLTTTNASNAGGFVRNMYQSTSAPSSGDGAVGDMWVLYS
tara:strand:+ start:236 stop:2140 length:1905 start_codon:yes stop_codon:yes gene_type:complete